MIPNANQLNALIKYRHLAWSADAQAKKSAKTKGVARPYAKNSTPPSLESCIAGGKAGKGRTGLAICAYLIFIEAVENAENAVKLFNIRRTTNGKGLGIAS